MTPRRLHLLRHGSVKGQGGMIGHTDAAPTAEGIALCRLRAQGLQVAEVIASDLARAQIPAAQIALDLGAPLAVDPRWREMHFGLWEGHSAADLGDAALRFWENPDGFPPPQGESWSALGARVGAALADVREDALVVAHAGAIRAALCGLLGFSYRQVWTINLPYAALVSLQIWPDGAQLTGLCA